MFGYSCPSCSQRLLASIERVGQRTICPKCVRPIVIPSPTAEVSEPASQVLTPSPAMDHSPDEVPIDLMPAIDEEMLSDVRMTLADDFPAGPDHSGIYMSGYSVDPMMTDSSVNDSPPSPTPRPLPPAAATIHPMPTPPPMPSPIRSEPSAKIAGNLGTSAPNITLPTAYHGKPSVPPPATIPPHTDIAYGVIGTHAPFFGPPIGFPRAKAPVPQPQPPSPDTARNGAEPGMIVFNPTEFESADLAAELTAALTMRMKPPPEPPSDLRLSTGLWIALTTIAIGLWAYCMLTNLEPLRYLAYLALAELGIGYLWVGYYAGRRSTVKGLITLLPPIWFRRLIAPPEALGYRPLRFIITGLLLLALYFISPAIQPTISSIAGTSNGPSKPTVDLTETPTMTLIIAEQENNFRAMLTMLRMFSAPESLLDRSIEADLPKLLPKLLELRTSKSSDMRTEALSAYITLTYDKRPADAKAELLKAMRSDDDQERVRGMELVSRWKDIDLASAVAQNLSSSDYGSTAYATLETIGGETTEAAVLPLLKSDDILAYSRAVELLERFGGPKALAAFEKLESAAKTNTRKSEYRQSIKRIQSRLNPS